MALNEFLVYLTGVGGVVATSWALEKISWFQNLDGTKKQLVFFGACLLISLGAYSVQTYVPPAVLEQFAPFFTIVSATFASIFLGTSFHKSSKKEEDGQG